MTDKPVLTVQLASPRGFCAGVDRAIQIVEKALERYGAPVYVRHEIVHNKHVVNRLEAMGAVARLAKHSLPRRAARADDLIWSVKLYVFRACCLLGGFLHFVRIQPVGP